MTDEEKTTRDIFAAFVIQASLSHIKNMLVLGIGHEEGIAELAKDAFVMADAMMKAREIKNDAS